MLRREFLRLSALSLLPILSCSRKYSSDFIIDFPIQVNSDRAAGHLLFQSQDFPLKEVLRKDVLIVGGGLAGLSAAYQYREQDFILFEAGEELGGSSSSIFYKGQRFSQGAHYDLAYPANYGREVLNFLEELNLIQFNSVKESWDFVDKKYLIRADRESYSKVGDSYRSEVLLDGRKQEQFIDLLMPYHGEMKLPSRLIDQKFYPLNQISFSDFLQQNLSLGRDFLEGLDYQMRDDYGASADQVSALAGIHYYMCRPYYIQDDIELFSPPEGNYFFVQKIAEQLPSDSLICKHVVRNIVPKKEEVEVEVIDVEERAVKKYRVKKVIYAAQKHALKYVYPNDVSLFGANAYAPWLVINLMLKEEIGGVPYWQNEILGSNKDMLGFIDSRAQFMKEGEKPCLTAYYCFSPEERNYLVKLEDSAKEIVAETIRQISEFLKVDISGIIEKAFLKLMGHAMPIPVPDYLFKDGNNQRSDSRIVYAGVDNGRLPLMFEAIDSGILTPEW